MIRTFFRRLRLGGGLFWFGRLLGPRRLWFGPRRPRFGRALRALRLARRPRFGRALLLARRLRFRRALLLARRPRFGRRGSFEVLGAGSLEGIVSPRALSERVVP